jgi:Tfp pilus assembly protein PilF
MGIAYCTQGNYSQAIATFQKAISIKPDYAWTYGNLSFSYIFVKEYVLSEQSARKGLAIDHTQTWIKTNLAAALLFQGKYEDAKKVYLELALIKERSDGKTNAAVCLEDLDDYENAGAILVNRKTDVLKIKQLLNQYK